MPPAFIDLYFGFYFEVHLGFAAADPAPLPDGDQAGHGALPNQVALELSQGGEDVELVL